MTKRDGGRSDARAAAFGCLSVIAAIGTVPLLVLFVVRLVREPLSDSAPPGGQLAVRRELPAQSIGGFYQCLNEPPIEFVPATAVTWHFECNDMGWGLEISGSGHGSKRVHLSGTLDVPATTPLGAVRVVIRGAAAVPVGTDRQHFTNERLDIGVPLQFEVRSPEAVVLRRLLIRIGLGLAALASALLTRWFYRRARDAGLGR